MNLISRGVALGALLLSAGQALAQDTVVLRESVGARAAELEKLELQPFDTSLWTTLESWTNGDAVDAASTEGKVVLIATLASWNPASKRSIGMIQSLKTKYADQGLLVVGVHHPQGWDSAAEALSQRKADFLIAHDASGKFREGIKADQDTDFYIIDRAGQLRFADVRNESVEPAIKALLAEDVASASTLRDRLAEQARLQDAEFAKPKAIQDQINLRALPEVAFTPPTPQAYGLADWPVRKKDDNNSRRDEDLGPRPLPLPASGWHGAVPNATGRAVAYYAWRLDDPRGTQIVREMEQLQRRLGRDAVIVGVLTGLRAQDNRSGNDDENIDPQMLTSRLSRMLRTYSIEHPMLIDLGGQLFTDDGSSRRSDEDYAAVVVSSDSVVRWEGVVSDPAFRAALDRVMTVDPGVQARRAAEAEYIRTKGG